MTSLSAVPRPASTSSLRYITGAGGMANRDDPWLVPDTFDVNVDRARRQQRQELVGPFDDRHAVTREQLVEAEIEQLREALRAIRVDVMHGHATAILVDENEGRAHDPAGHPEPARQALRKARLARAELARQRDDVTGSETLRESHAHGVSLLGAAALDHALTRLKASGNAVITSRAISDSSPMRSAAMSPATP